MRTLTTIAAAVFWCMATVESYCQVNQWPMELAVPQEKTQSSKDSNKTNFVSEQSLYIQTFNSKDSFVEVQNSNNYSLQQSAIYEINNDGLFDSKNQFLDMSGVFLRKNVVPHISLGFDWTPQLIQNSRKINQAVFSSMDVGPVAKLNYLQIPLTLRGGIALKSWNDSVPTNNPLKLKPSEFSSDEGYYGAFEFGNFLSILPYLPLHVSLKGYGRNMATSKLIAGNLSVLFERAVATGDSIFALYTDSLIDGRDASLSQGAEGKSRYINDSRRIERSYRISGGIKGLYRFLLQPSLVYSFSRYSIMYPSQTGLSSDRQNTDNAINFMLCTDPSFPFNYSGGLRVDWEDENKLFEKNIEMAPNINLSNLDSLRVKLNGYNGYKATLQQRLSLFTKNGIGLEYSFNISRYAQTYSNYYMLGSETVRNNEDNDWILQCHHIDITPIVNTTAKLIVSGDYSTNLRYYLKKERSSDNSTDFLYKLGENLVINPLGKLRFEEELTAEAKKTQYEFPNAGNENLKMPPYSRKFSSKLGLFWNYARHATMHVEWQEIYTDDGYWYNGNIDTAGTGTIDTSQTRSNPYYAILRKSWEHSIVLSVNDTLWGRVVMEVGSSFKDITDYEFKNHQYSLRLLKIGYAMIPFLSLNSELNEHLRIKLLVKRYIDTIADDFWNLNFIFSADF